MQFWTPESAFFFIFLTVLHCFLIFILCSSAGWAKQRRVPWLHVLWHRPALPSTSFRLLSRGPFMAAMFLLVFCLRQALTAKIGANVHEYLYFLTGFTFIERAVATLRFQWANVPFCWLLWLFAVLSRSISKLTLSADKNCSCVNSDPGSVSTTSVQNKTATCTKCKQLKIISPRSHHLHLSPDWTADHFPFCLAVVFGWVFCFVCVLVLFLLFRVWLWFLLFFLMDCDGCWIMYRSFSSPLLWLPSLMAAPGMH